MKRFSTYINENKKPNIDSLPTKKTAILFTDIKGSSNLWTNNEDEMFDSLNNLEKLMEKLISNNKGLIVKTIGDSYMCSFESEDGLFDAIKMAIDIQKSLDENPIKVNDQQIELRIGICYGDVYIKETQIQGVNLKDYFGNSVNTASRMESKVSETNGFAFSFLKDIDNDNEEEILNFLQDNDIDIKVIEYDNNCKQDKNRKRSARLLTDLQVNICKKVDDLKGVKSVRVYKCKLL